MFCKPISQSSRRPRATQPCAFFSNGARARQVCSGKRESSAARRQVMTAGHEVSSHKGVWESCAELGSILLRPSSWKTRMALRHVATHSPNTRMLPKTTTIDCIALSRTCGFPARGKSQRRARASSWVHTSSPAGTQVGD
jgi:hypothetical protein